MNLHPLRQEGYDLLHNGMIEFSQVEANGMRVDLLLLQKTKEDLTNKIRSIRSELQDGKVWRLWKKRFGEKANLGSRDQWKGIFYGELGFEPIKTTAKGKDAADDEALKAIDHPFIPLYQKLSTYKKVLDTFIRGIEAEIVGDRVHPSLNLHIARSYRSSCDTPNLQNVPVRDDEIGGIIRRLFIPSDGNVMPENDFKGVEVSISTAYHHDRNFISYITTPGKDMHRDMAAQIYCLRPEEVSKEARHGAKNSFVFPQFYGDYYVACAKHLWAVIEKQNLKGPGGVPLKEHLKKKGIYELGECDPDQVPRKGTFEKHLQEVEHDFWNNRFREYGQWKRDYYKSYLENGYFDILTGFRVSGNVRRNAVCNYGTQGCLAGGSRVLTKDGLIPIKGLVGKRVEVWTGFRWAEAVGLDRGECRRARIHLSSGLIVECDTRHNLKNERDSWVKFSDLRVGDLVALPRTSGVFEASEEMNWWFIFGFIVGDGCVSNSVRKNLVITGGETKRNDVERIHRFFLDQGFKSGGYRAIHFDVIRENGGSNKYKLSIQDNLFAVFLEQMGFVFGATAHTKRVPFSVWTASPQEQRNFLEGLWRSDGARSPKAKHSLHMCNQGLLQEIQILSYGLGFDSVLSSTKAGAWLLRFNWNRKSVKSTRRYPWRVVNSKVKRVESVNYLDRNQYITDLRAFSAKSDPTQFVGERLIERNGSGGEQIYRFDSISKIEVLGHSETTYTMSVNDPLHQFVADGVIHKNSAFHCLLWTLIQVNRAIRKYKMKSRIVMQIHDSIVGDVRVNELRDYEEIIEETVKVKLREHYKWMAVPLEIENELAIKNWHEKKPFVFTEGAFIHPTNSKLSTRDTDLFIREFQKPRIKK